MCMESSMMEIFALKFLVFPPLGAFQDDVDGVVFFIPLRMMRQSSSI